MMSEEQPLIEAWLPAFNILPFSTDAIKILEILLRVPDPSPASLLDDLTSRENQLEQTYRLFRVCGQDPLTPMLSSRS
jgi:hypothetical protein